MLRSSVDQAKCNWSVKLRAGFVHFVLRLKKGQYLEQFGQYAWTHMILLVVFIPTSFFVSNIFDGLIWFLLPCALVIINDIGAYLVGAQVLMAQPHCYQSGHHGTNSS